MNANGIAKHYDKLNGPERFALIAAAAARGDHAERQRLLDSAPWQTWRLPQHWEVCTDFERLSHIHFMELLKTASFYLESFAVALGTKPKQRADPLLRDLWDGVMLAGYRFQVNLAGWRMFCDELGVAPEWFWEHLPGMETVRRVARWTDPDPKTGSIARPAFTAEGVARCAAERELGKRDAEAGAETLARFQPVTAEDIVAELRFCWDKLRERWE